MDVILYILSGLLMVLGLLGCFLPVLPGPALNYIGLLVVHFTQKVSFSIQFLLVWAGIVIAVAIADHFIPSLGARTFGSSKYGVWGSLIGLVLGMFVFPPWGIILGPFVGAVVGELINGQNIQNSLKAGGGTFVGLLLGLILKLIATGMMIFYYVKAVVA
ncbi:MAG: DUF456 domain-containing protein [Cyclobacteriaceae bacterium]